MVPIMYIVKHIEPYIIYRHTHMYVEVKTKWIHKTLLNVRVEVMKRKNVRELLFYLNILVLKIQCEVNMTKC